MTGKINDAMLPPDMLMMLGRMDGKLDSLLQQTTANTAELKTLSSRVSDLEADRKETGVLREQFRKVVIDVEELKTAKAEATGGWKGAAWAATAGKFAVGLLIGGIGALGLQLGGAKKPANVAKVEQTYERSVTLPAKVH